MIKTIRRLMPPESSRKRADGFTMVELIAVIVIAGVLAVSASSLLSTQVFDERFVFEDALSGARYAQTMAIGRGCAVQYSIDSSSFELMHDVNCAVVAPQSFTSYVYRPFASNGGVADQYRNADFPTGLTVTATTVVFYPQGWACASDGSDHSAVAIVFSGQSSRTMTIECGTGFVY